jgi:predicted Zn-ribbon and HTH transcriptional regulator
LQRNIVNNSLNTLFFIFIKVYQEKIQSTTHTVNPAIARSGNSKESSVIVKIKKAAKFGREPHSLYVEEGMYDTKKCQYCGKEININYMVCPLCGGHLKDDVRSVPPECPRCRVRLEVQVHDGDEYDLCPLCGGMWLDMSEFDRATRTSDVYRKEDTRSDYLPGPACDPPGYIP